MTFEQFQATRKACENLGAAINAEFGDTPVGGFTYLDALYIEDTASWTDTVAKPGRYYLLINRSDWFSDDLEPLERRLYDYAVSEDYFSSERAALTREYEEWLLFNDMAEVCAEQLILEPLSGDQRKWLTDFMQRWEIMEEKEDSER